MNRAPLPVLLAFFVACGGSPPAGEAPVQPRDEGADPAAESRLGATRLGEISVVAPAGWVSTAPSSPMRVAQWTIGSGAGAAELVVFFFEGGAGTVQANLDRWYSQFVQADGSDSASAAVVETHDVSGLAVTTVDLSGRYVAAVRPGADEKFDLPDQRMRAAIVETAAGHYYFKLLGPSATVAAVGSEFDALVASIRAEAKVDPHGGSPHGGDPHGGNPHGGNPHGQ